MFLTERLLQLWILPFATSVHSVTITKYHKLAFINNRHLFLKVLGAGGQDTSRFSIWALAHFLVHTWLFLMCSHNAEEIRELSEVSFIGAPIHS